MPLLASGGPQPWAAACFLLAIGGQSYTGGQKMQNMSTVAGLMAFTAKKKMNTVKNLYIKMSLSKS